MFPRSASKISALLSLFCCSLLVLCCAIQADAQIQKKLQLKKDQEMSLEKTPPPMAQVELRQPSKTWVKLWTGQGSPGKEFFGFSDVVPVAGHHDGLNAWYIEWGTTEEDVRTAVLQVSMHPYPYGGEWTTPPGLLMSQPINSVRATGSQSRFTVDIASCLPGGEETLDPAVAGEPDLNKRLRTTGVRRTTENRFQVAPSGTATEFRMMRPKRLKVPVAVTLYVRVVTLNSRGQMVGQPSPAARLHYRDEAPQDTVNWYGQPELSDVPYDMNGPSMRIASYEPFRVNQSDWSRYFIVTRDTYFYKKGDKLYLPRSDGSKGAWDAISGAFGSIGGFVSSAVNWVSQAYTDIKAKALELAVSLAKNTVGCGDICQAGFSFALDYGLAAMGMPPSLPNFDELSSLGKDYLIKRIAAETEPFLSEEEVAKAINYMEAELKEVADHGPGGDMWLKLDPDYQYRDALLMLDVWNPTHEKTNMVHLTLEQSKSIFYFPYEPRRYIIEVPPLSPGESIKLPIFLRPNSVQYNNGHGLLQSDWNRLIEGTVTLKVTMTSNNPPIKDQIVISN